MKYCAHTMGTPSYDIFEAFRLVGSLGFDGIEIRCCSDAQIDPQTFDFAAAPAVRRAADDAGVQIVCLTPYYMHFGDPERREKEIEGLCRTIDIAAELGGGLVRCFGREPEDNREREDYWWRTVEALAQCADHARPTGVRLALETHGGSLAQTAGKANRMIEDIGRTNVGIILDYPWIYLTGEEGPREATERAAANLLHVHVKDWSKNQATGERTTCLMGEGDIEWPTVLQVLRELDFSGYICAEYEKCHRPYLPEPEVGLKHELNYLQQFFD